MHVTEQIGHEARIMKDLGVSPRVLDSSLLEIQLHDLAPKILWDPGKSHRIGDWMKIGHTQPPRPKQPGSLPLDRAVSDGMHGCSGILSGKLQSFTEQIIPTSNPNSDSLYLRECTNRIPSVTNGRKGVFPRSIRRVGSLR